MPERTLRRDARQNVERLKAAALEVFHERGLGAPLDAIARRAGVSVGTLYNRFGSREALIDAVVPAVARANLASVLADAHAGTDPWDRFARFLRGLGEMQIRDPAVSDAIVAAHVEGADELTAVCDEAFADGRLLIADAQRAGALRADFGDADLAALLYANKAIVHSVGADASRRFVSFTLDGLRAR